MRPYLSVGGTSPCLGQQPGELLEWAPVKLLESFKEGLQGIFFEDRPAQRRELAPNSDRMDHPAARVKGFTSDFKTPSNAR